MTRDAQPEEVAPEQDEDESPPECCGRCCGLCPLDKGHGGPCGCEASSAGGTEASTGTVAMKAY